jgi:hypothetical protein
MTGLIAARAQNASPAVGASVEMRALVGSQFTAEGGEEQE